MEFGIDIDKPINEDLIEDLISYAMPSLLPYSSSLENRLKYIIDYTTDCIICRFYIGRLYVYAEEKEIHEVDNLRYQWSDINVYILEKSVDGITELDELDAIDGYEIKNEGTLRNLAFSSHIKSARN